MPNEHDRLVTPSAPSETPVGWGERFRMPLFRAGTQVRYQGRWETVHYVALRYQAMRVYLSGRAEPVEPHELELEPTLFTTLRVGPIL